MALPRVAAGWGLALLLMTAAAAQTPDAPESRPASMPATRPTDRAGLTALALERIKTGALDDAVGLLDEAAALRPPDATTDVNLARALVLRAQARQRGNDPGGADDDYARALATAGQDPPTVVACVMWMRTRGDLFGARRTVDALVASSPMYAPAAEELARVAYEDDDLAAAVEALATTVKLDPKREAPLAEFGAKVRREFDVEKGFLRDERGPFVVKCGDREFASTADAVLDMLDAAGQRALATLGHVPRRHLTVVLYTQGDFATATGAHAWTGGLFDGKVRLPVRNFAATRDIVRATIMHEFMHRCVDDLTRRCPLWLNEGLAQIAEAKPVEHARDALRATVGAGGTVPRVAALPSSWFGVADANLVRSYYTQALVTTDFLVRREGWNAMREILKATDRLGFVPAFQKVTGQPFTDVEDALRLELGM